MDKLIEEAEEALEAAGNLSLQDYEIVEKTIRALVDRLKAQDIDIRIGKLNQDTAKKNSEAYDRLKKRLKAADEIMKLAATYQQTEKSYDWDVMYEALSKYQRIKESDDEA